MKRKPPAADPFDVFAPLDDAELDELDRFLVSDATSDDTLTLAGLDGYLTALVIGPVTVMPSRWLPGVWGGEDAAPEFESEAQAERIMGMLLRHMNSIVADFENDPTSFEPMVDVMTIEDHDYAVGETWALGFMQGVELARENWQPMYDSAEMADALRLLHVLGSEDADEEELDLVADPEEHARLTRQLPGALAAIHAFWLPYRHMAHAEATLATTVRRTEPKVGRNDPCPCGSGRKFKKCCGAAATKH